jgi:hypothetical protein
VTIGGQLRVNSAYVTSAGPDLEGPTTMMLYASTLTELSGFAPDPIAHDSVGGQALARLVLIDLRELTRHRRQNVERVTSRRWWGSPSRSSSRHATDGS